MQNIPQGLNNLAALRKLEDDFYNHFEFDVFYRNVLEYFLKHYGVEERTPLNVSEMKKLNEFVVDWFATKAATIEKFIVQAFVVGRLTNIQEEAGPIKLLRFEDLPITIQDASLKYNLTANQVRAMQFAEHQSAKNIVNIGTETAAKIHDILFENIKNGGYYRSFEQSLNKEFSDQGDLQKNWRLIAITETNSAYNNGYLAGISNGKVVIGLSMPRCCDFCDEFINGKIFFVINPKDGLGYDNLTPGTPEYIRRSWLWENCVWVGKFNFGRSRAINKKIDPQGSQAKDNLTPRAHHERWMPTIPSHPACRCKYLEINPSKQFLDKKGELKMKFQDEETWQNWHSKEIESRMKQLKKFGF